MKIGDKVRFLNTTGGGIVKGFQGKDIVIIDDDGFDTPVLIRECVVIEPAHEVQTRQSSKSAVESDRRTFDSPKQEVSEIVETKGGDLITACLAYLPIDAKNLSTTGYECFLVNDSNYFLSYSYMTRTPMGWTSHATGVIEPNTKLFLEEFNKENLNDMEKICVQFIPYKIDKPFKLKNPCSVELRIDTVKFYKLHSFKENEYFEDPAIIYYLMRKDLAEQEMNFSPEIIAEAMFTKEKDNRRPRIQKVDKKASNGIIEIDLHIDELIDTSAGLEAKDILEYQMEKFREIMNENIKNKGQKIVFIHGKGDGVLKKNILDELKTKYKNIYVQDASFKEYGFGATMVTIR